MTICCSRVRGTWMKKIENVRNIASNFKFRKGDYLDAERQLFQFAKCYAELKPEEADILRSEFDAKDRLGWFRIASTLFSKEFPDADFSRKDRLCMFFFSMYSFDNLDFGYDGLMDTIYISHQMKCNLCLARKHWDQFSRLTGSNAARRNLESKIFLN